jgi:hypothetical protein
VSRHRHKQSHSNPCLPQARQGLCPTSHFILP